MFIFALSACLSIKHYQSNLNKKNMASSENVSRSPHLPKDNAAANEEKLRSNFSPPLPPVVAFTSICQCLILDHHSALSGLSSKVIWKCSFKWNITSDLDEEYKSYISCLVALNLVAGLFLSLHQEVMLALLSLNDLGAGSFRDYLHLYQPAWILKSRLAFCTIWWEPADWYRQSETATPSSKVQRETSVRCWRTKLCMTQDLPLSLADALKGNGSSCLIIIFHLPVLWISVHRIGGDTILVIAWGTEYVLYTVQCSEYII